MAVGHMASNKAPGPDCIPNVVIRLAFRIRRLVLIPKISCALLGPSSFRPLCMLDAMGKLLERMVLRRLQRYLEDAETGLSPQQFGFRPGRSTVDALREVSDTVRQAWEGDVRRCSHVAMIAIDVRNAFNTARWDRILVELHSSGVPN